MADVPVACKLDPDELGRRQNLLWHPAERSVERREVDDGYSLTFPPGAVALHELGDLIERERRCCPFLRFTLVVEPAHGPVCLEVTGTAGTKDFLTGLLTRPERHDLGT